MSSSTISVNKFSASIDEILEEFADAQTDYLDEGLHAGAKLAAKEWRANAPVMTGAYKKSIRFKKSKDDPEKPEYRVYAASPHYRIVHLLEKGHAKVGGGRVEARVHVAPAAEAGFEKAYEAVRSHYA